MSGIIILIILEMLELGFILWDFRRKSNSRREKAVTRVTLFALFLLMVISPVINWGFAWYGLGFLLLIQAVFGVIAIARGKKAADRRRSRIILSGIGRCLLIGVAVFPAVLFPPADVLLPTGSYSVGTAVYTWADDTRDEAFTAEKDHRRVTVQFFYPTREDTTAGMAVEGADIAADGNYPLLIFSHGAFGYRRSNYSAYMELASHGYIVCSIDHTYHAFFTKEEDGNIIPVNLGFLKEVQQLEDNKFSLEEGFCLEQKWLKLRTEDLKFVLNRIKTTAKEDSNGLFQGIDLEHIGAFGHSLGGAAAAQAGRELEDIDAVMVLDGTMLGEVTGVEDGRQTFIDTPYPKPILNFYNESHYKINMLGSFPYANKVASEHAADSYQVVIRGSGHLNFTDLPMFSPILAGMLGTGEVDARTCILEINETVLEFFDHYLKGVGGEIPRERTF